MQLIEIFENTVELAEQIGDEYSDDPAERLGYVTEEVGEFAREVISLGAARRRGDITDEEVNTRLRQLAVEGFDTMWNLCATMRACGITAAGLEIAARAKIEKNRKRKFPTHGRPLKH